MLSQLDRERKGQGHSKNQKPQCPREQKTCLPKKFVQGFAQLLVPN